MFSHSIEAFGTFEKHILQNKKGDMIALVPAFGANLLDVQFSNISILDGYQTPEELVENKWSKNIILFPFPNRLRDGKYQYGGKTYQFDINNANTNNAIHGFSKNVEMQVTHVEAKKEFASITCTYTHAGTHKAYPFHFTFHVTFILRGGSLELEMTFTNTDKVALPVGLGWHPYFRISDKSDDTSLRMPNCQLIDIDERKLPTGNKIEFTGFEKITKIGNTSLDNGFYITNRTKNAEVILKSDKGTLSYWQETGAAKWNFLQVFTPPHRQSIALEPMTCNIDAFNNQDGLVHLLPKASLQGRFGISFK